MIQGSAEWLAARIGKVTASRMADVMARTKTGYSAARGHYLLELVTERLTGLAAEHYVSAAMQWGTDHEAQARAGYEFLSDASVELVGFVDHPTIAMSGASPDGLVGADGLVEIKCPTSKTHIETALADGVPAPYLPQIMWQMACTGRAWCDFVSFDPRLPADLQFVVRRIDRDEALIADMAAEVTKLLDEVATAIARLRR